jgi:curved DNA-binding protein CbpA
VSVIPKEIPDFGSAQLAPRQNPRFSPGAGFTTEDYFVWSRVDGHATLRDIILMAGLGTERAIAILRKLRSTGAVLLPGETPETPTVVAALATKDAPVRRPRPPSVAPPFERRETPPVGLDDLGALSPDEERAMGEVVQLQDQEKRRIIQVMRLVTAGDYFAVLGVPREVDKRELKRAYFRLSKEFHPDRHYAQKLGSFAPWLNRIFETATRAFQVLSDAGSRAAHIASLDDQSEVAARPQDRASHAADLFERACVIEASGDQHAALRLFAAAVKVEALPRYLRRAATCALACGELSDAEHYAKYAARLRADDASYARLLADVYRAAGKLNEAERILLGALALPTVSDLLARELEADLAACSRERLRPPMMGNPSDE